MHLPTFLLFIRSKFLSICKNYSRLRRFFRLSKYMILAREIHAEQQQFNPFPLCSYYNIDHRELKTGLLCRYCNSQLQRKNREKWFCEPCGKNTVNPYNDGINDWFMLVKNSITNEECRSFLNLKGFKCSSLCFIKVSSCEKREI